MDETVKRYSAEISRKYYEAVPETMENSGDIFIGVPQASRRVLWRKGRPEISEVEIIVHFNGGHEKLKLRHWYGTLSVSDPLI